ncbi:MAG: alpha/beta fold hydrolase [Longimicrobiales bacterium]
MGELEVAWREAGEGRAILFLHGFPLDGSLWKDSLGALPDGWRGIAPDLRGFGDSEPGENGLYSMDRFAADALALLDHLGVDRFAVCGLSMGGYVAFRLWSLARERIDGVALVDTRPGTDDEEARVGRRTLAARARGEGTAFLADELVQKLLGPATFRERPDAVQRLREMILRQPAESVARAALGMARRRDSTALLVTIQVPTLVLVGSDDIVTPVEEAERMADAIPDAALAVVPAAGHLPPLERPEEFHEALHHWLRSLRAP